MMSIIIPAHNEAAVIARTLSLVTEGLTPGEADIIVVCNGCSDNTAAIARGAEGPIRVVETTVADKANALNLGDRVAGGVFPRFYIDADVAVPLNTIRALAARLNQGDILAVAPSGRMDLRGCSWSVRWFHHIASLLPSAREGIGGSGVYALSREGRNRFDAFPALIADDAFVRLQFEQNECETLDAAKSKVFPPHTLTELIRVRTRVRYGHLEVARRYPQLWQERWKSNNRALLALFTRPILWPQVMLYCFVTIVARIEARRRIKYAARKWERDGTSRSQRP